MEVTYTKLLRRKWSGQIAPSNNFTMAQRIHTSSSSIDAASPVHYDRMSGKLRKLNLVDHFPQKKVYGEFITLRLMCPNNFWTDWAEKCQRKFTGSRSWNIKRWRHFRSGTTHLVVEIEKHRSYDMFLADFLEFSAFYDKANYECGPQERPMKPIWITCQNPMTWLFYPFFFRKQCVLPQILLWRDYLMSRKAYLNRQSDPRHERGYRRRLVARDVFCRQVDTEYEL
jgi:hypothetical protein